MTRRVRVLVLGAYGLIGSEIVTALVARGHDVTGLGRRDGRRLRPSIRWYQRDIASLTVAAEWLALLEDIDVVVNAAGALQAGPGDDLAAVHVEAIGALLTACEDQAVARFVQISAVGVREDASSPFLATKARGDALVRASALDWLILRPGMVIARGTYGGSALLRAIAMGPALRVGGLGQALVQTVSAGELAAVVCEGCSGELPSRHSFDVVEDDARSLDDTIATLRRWLGRSGLERAPVVPRAALFVLARVADGLGWLGWRSPLRSTAIDVLGLGVRGDPAPLRSARARSLSSLEWRPARCGYRSFSFKSECEILPWPRPRQANRCPRSTLDSFASGCVAAFRHSGACWRS